MKYRVCCGSGILNVLPTNRSFTEAFEGENPIYPVGGDVSINKKLYKIIDFQQKSTDTMKVKVMKAT